ncbi:MAG TPA: uroporphyrinogen decarboxylase family protein [Verrucomicrobiota bacterium]|jgi:MtaA/CmuA family methyltransferase|nr:uroporphyrinogen decarboxylase family protein [Verrucomicrobiota bacterium]HQL80343.1 uroporphyrinogen decarboxylase family protein [Verrucomicrobiota bacterium]
MNSRERVLAHLAGQPVDRLPLMPITMMFACGQIGARYRDYCTDYRVLVEGQIRTAEAFGFDYVNTMSDPAREAADCGAPVEYFDHQPVALVEDQALLADKTRLASLKVPDPLGGGRMHNGLKALDLHKARVGKEKIIEGWVEGPIAEAADLRGINTLMMDFFDDPAFVRDLFAFVIEMELRFAREQIRAGADIIGVGDAAASLVGPQIYDEFVWPYEKQLVDGIQALGGKVRLHICGNTRRILEGMGRLGCDIIDLDSLAPISEARQKMGTERFLLGNLNPVTVLRNGDPAGVTAAVAECHRQAGPRFIVGAGCEVPRDTPAENLCALCAYAHSHRP